MVVVFEEEAERLKADEDLALGKIGNYINISTQYIK